MPDETGELLTSVLRLPPAVRAHFAHEILASLDDAEDADAAELWRAELERRADDVLAGRAELEDADVVHEQLNARLRTMSGEAPLPTTRRAPSSLPQPSGTKLAAPAGPGTGSRDWRDVDVP